MSYDAHANFSYSTIATAPSPATSGTSLTVQSGHGSRFPAASFNAVIWPAGQLALSTNAEIVRVTAKSTDTFTITRTQENTSARSIQVGDQIATNITAKWFTDIETNKLEKSGDTMTGDLIVTGIATALSSKTTTYSITTTDSILLCSASGGAFTVTLPTAASVSGRSYSIKKTDSTSNAVTIATTLSQTIDGQTTQLLGVQYQSITVVSDGSNWFII